MRVGIDYSTSHPAVCIIDDSGEIFLFALSGVKKHRYTSTNLNIETMPKEFASKFDRSLYTSSWVLSVLSKFQGIKDVQIESLSLNSKGASGIDLAVHAGILYHRLHEAGYSQHLITPSSVKKQFTKNGCAKKPMMCDEFVKRTGINISSLIGCKQYDSPENDLVDSYAVAVSTFDPHAPSYHNKGC